MARDHFDGGKESYSSNGSNTTLERGTYASSDLECDANLIDWWCEPCMFVFAGSYHLHHCEGLKCEYVHGKRSFPKTLHSENIHTIMVLQLRYHGSFRGRQAP